MTAVVVLLFEITKVRVGEARACAEEEVEGRERGERDRERRERESRAGGERCVLLGEQELERQVEEAAEGLIRALQVKRDIVKCNKPYQALSY